MTLHIKLVISLLAGLLIVVAAAQTLQYRHLVSRITDFSESNRDLLNQREKEFARNIFMSVNRAVAGSLERGEMEKFTKLLQAQREVEGLLEFSLYDRKGMISHSSHTHTEKTLPPDIMEKASSSPETGVMTTEDAIIVYQPQMINHDCIRCHFSWETGKSGGVTYLRFSTEALKKSGEIAETAVEDIKNSIIMISFISVGGIVLVSFVAMFFLVSKFVSEPLKNTVERLRDIAEGEGDLNRRLEIDSEDEVGELARWFNAFSEKLRDMVRHVALDIGRVNASSDSLLVISDDMANKADQMHELSSRAASAAQQTSENIRVMADAAEQVSTQVESVNELSAKVSERMSGIREATSIVSNNIDMNASANRQISHTVTAIAASMEEMSTSLNEVAKYTSRAANMTGEASDKANEASVIIHMLGKAADQIGSVVDLIMNIASQTNLLALNATIEATGAGAAGRGFAVVANEVKELARQTGKSTGVIRQTVRDIQKKTETAIGAIESIVNVTAEINSIMEIIAAAVEQQTASINEIAKNVTETATTTNSVSDNAHEAALRAEETAKNVQEAAMLESDVSEKLKEVAKAALAIAKEAAHASAGTQAVSRHIADVDEAARVTAKGAARTRTQARDLEGFAEQLQIIIRQFKA